VWVNINGVWTTARFYNGAPARRRVDRVSAGIGGGLHRRADSCISRSL